jgi:hypothetical protein
MPHHGAFTDRKDEQLSYTIRIEPEIHSQESGSHMYYTVCVLSLHRHAKERSHSFKPTSKRGVILCHFETLNSAVIERLVGLRDETVTVTIR